MCPQKPNIFSLIVFLNPDTIAVAKIITTMLRAIATTAKRRIALEKDFLVAVPTRLAIKNSRFKMSIDLVIFDNT